MPYRVLSPFLALTRDPERFKSLNEGSIIHLEGQPNKTGLVDVMHEGEIVAVFMIDVRNRCEPVTEQRQAKPAGV